MVVGFADRMWRRRYPLMIGTVVGVILGATLAAGNLTIYEQLATLSPRPENFTETGNLLVLEWRVVYFLVVALIPLAVVYLAGGRGWSGWVAILAYAVTWWAVASAVPLGVHAATAQRYALVTLAVYELFAIGGSPEMTSESSPWMWWGGG